MNYDIRIDRHLIRAAIAKLARIDARGSTDLHGGWRAGCDQLAAHLGAMNVGRCLLLTDGQANVGIVDPAGQAGQAGACAGSRCLLPWRP